MTQHHHGYVRRVDLSAHRHQGPPDLPCQHLDLPPRIGRRALACAGLEASDLDGIILATATPDNLLPSAASAVQKKLGAVNAAVFDLNAACTGFVYSLSVATSLVQTGMMKKVLVIGAERLTYLLDWARRDTAVLFGDGAGAVVIEAQASRSVA